MRLKATENAVLRISVGNAAICEQINPSVGYPRASINDIFRKLHPLCSQPCVGRVCHYEKSELPSLDPRLFSFAVFLP